MRTLRPAITLLTLLACVGHASAGGPCSISVGGGVRKMTREQCALKAVEAMGAKEKLLVAEVDAEGNARGWNENNTVQVLSFRQPDEAQVVVLIVAVGKDAKETDRLRNAVAAHVLDGPANPATPKRIAAEGAPKESPAPAVRWAAASRNNVSTTRFFDVAASLVLEKRGYQVMPQGKPLVLGGRPSGVVAAMFAPGSTAMEHYLVVAVGGEEDKECQRLAQEYVTRIIHTLYE